MLTFYGISLNNFVYELWIQSYHLRKSGMMPRELEKTTRNSFTMPIDYVPLNILFVVSIVMFKRLKPAGKVSLGFFETMKPENSQAFQPNVLVRFTSAFDGSKSQNPSPQLFGDVPVR